jgi:hypothetical protein
VNEREEMALAIVRAIAVAAAAMQPDPATPPTEVSMRSWNRARRRGCAAAGHAPLAHELLRQLNARRQRALSWHQLLRLAFGE